MTKNKTKLRFDPEKGRLYFDGCCDEVRDVCGAFCCKFYGVDLYEEERKGGLYRYDMICGLNGSDCVGPDRLCMNRRYVLSKKEDGSCIYLDMSKKCGIYEKRPRSCRDFYCDLGWGVSGAVQNEDYQKISFDSLKEGFKSEMKLAINPALKVKTIFYSHEKKEISFVTENPAKCGYMPLRHSFPGPGAPDEALILIYRSFDGRRDMKEVFRHVTASFPDLSKDTFMNMVTVLFRLRLLIPEHDDLCPKTSGGWHG